MELRGPLGEAQRWGSGRVGEELSGNSQMKCVGFSSRSIPKTIHPRASWLRVKLAGRMCGGVNAGSPRRGSGGPG